MTENKDVIAELEKAADQLCADLDKVRESIMKAGADAKMARVHELYNALSAIKYLRPSGYGSDSVMVNSLGGYFLRVVKTLEAQWKEELYNLKRDEQVMEAYKEKQLAQWHSWDKKPEKNET